MVLISVQTIDDEEIATEAAWIGMRF